MSRHQGDIGNNILRPVHASNFSKLGLSNLKGFKFRSSKARQVEGYQSARQTDSYCDGACTGENINWA